MKFVFALGISIGLAAVAQEPPPNHVLDLVGHRPAPAMPSSRGIPPGGLSVGTHSGRTLPSLRVTLLSLDRSDYRTGDPVIYEVMIQNVGTTPVELPWSPDAHLFSDLSFAFPQVASASVRQSFLSLEILGAGAQRLASLEPRPLFGHHSVAGSLQTLAPRATAWIRVPGFWRTTDDQIAAILRESEHRVWVHSQFMLSEDLLIVRSTNSIEVTVQSSLRPRGA